MTDTEIEQMLARFSHRTGIEDVRVSCRYYEGSYYSKSPDNWFGWTRRFNVGPHASLEAVLERLEVLEQIFSTAALTGTELRDVGLEDTAKKASGAADKPKEL